LLEEELTRPSVEDKEMMKLLMQYRSASNEASGISKKAILSSKEAGKGRGRRK
jgi:hypothetical protein